MMDLRHTALKFATLPLAGEVDRCTDPDALGNTKRLFQNSLEQRLDLSVALAEPWNRIRCKTIRNEQRGRRRGHHRPRQLLACHHRTKKTDLIGIEGHAKRRDRVKGEHPSEPLRLHQEHPRGDDAAGRMRSEMAELDIQRVERRQHVLCMLLHGVVGVVGIRLWPVAFAAAAPVHADHAQAAGKHRCGKLDPVLAGEIAVDEDDGDVASSPFSPTQLDLARLQPCHDRLYLFRPAVGDAPGGVGATGSADTTAPRIMRSVASGEVVSTEPLVTKSTTSTGYSTGLSVWMKCPVSG